MDQEELHAILKQLYSSVGSSSSPFPSSFSSDTTITTPVVPRSNHNIQDSTIHGQESFSHLHTYSSTTVSINAYNSQNSTFQSEISWPPFLSEINRSQTYDINNINWGLHDFVKSFNDGVNTSTSTKATTNSTIINNTDTSTRTLNVEPYIPQNPFIQREEHNLLQPNHVYNMEESLHDPFDPFDFPKLKIPNILHISSTPPRIVSKVSQDMSYHNHNHQLLHGITQAFDISSSTNIAAKSITRSKKRKNQMKMIFQVPFEEKLSTRYWRKYGQKPIKGSPYPRGYYRCSAFEGCMAKKRVERKKTDPSLLIITYTGKHNHSPLPFEDPLGENSNDRHNNEDNSTPFLHIASASKELVKTNIMEEEIDNIGDENVTDDVFEALTEIVDLSYQNI